MGKTREYYYGDIKKWLMSKDELPKGRLQVAIFQNALNEAIEETRKLPNGELRLKAVNDVLFAKTKTYAGVGQELHYDWRTIQNWVTSFVYLVGRKAGF